MPVVTTSIAVAYSLGTSQHLSSFTHISFRRRPTTSLHAMMPTRPFLLSSSYSSISFRTIPIPLLSPSDSHHAVIVRGVVCPSPSIRKYCAASNPSSKYLNSFASNCAKPNWTPPISIQNLFGPVDYKKGKPDYSLRHWLVSMETFGIEFDSEQALFNYYIETLAAVVGSAEEAKRRIYLVSCGLIFGFGAEINESTADELRGQLGVLRVEEDFEFECRDKNPRVEAQFTPVNQNHRLDDLFSYHYLSESNLEWSSNHWLVHIKQPGGEFTTKQETVDLCFRIVAEVVGSEEEARRKIYIIWNKSPFGLGVEIDEDTSIKLKAHPDVLRVLLDYAFDVKMEDAVLVISPSSCLKSDSAYYKYQSKDLSGHSLSQSPPCFTLIDSKCWLGNILSYHHHLSEPNIKWNSDHWLIITKQPEDGFMVGAQTLEFYIKVLAEVVGSEEEAKEKIYIIWCNFPFGFGAEIDGETSNKLKDCVNVLNVVPDYSFDVKDKFTGIRVISSSFCESKFHYYTTNKNWDKLADQHLYVNSKHLDS